MIAVFIVGIIFTAITAWKWMELEAGRAKPDPVLARRVDELEAEVARLRDLVADAVIATHEAAPFVRLTSEPPRTSLDAS